MSPRGVIKALTIHQPFAWAVAEEHKPVENRDWKPPDEVRWLAIHAGSKPSVKKSANPETNSVARIEQLLHSFRDMSDEWEPPRLEELQFGAILAVARIHEIHVAGTPFHSEWRNQQRFGWVLRDVVKLDAPLPCKGMQQLWSVPTRYLATLREAVINWRERQT